MSSFTNLYYFRNITNQSEKVKNPTLNEQILKNEENKDINKIYDYFVNPPKKPIVHGM